MLKRLFAFPVEIWPAGSPNWRIRWIPLLVWVCLVNGLIMALLYAFPAKDGPREALPADVQKEQLVKLTSNYGIRSSTREYAKTVLS